MGKRVPEPVSRERYACDRCVLGADRPQPGVRQRSTFTDEDCLVLNGRSSFEVCLYNSTSFDGQRHDALFVSFAVTTNNLPGSWSDRHIIEFKPDDLRRSKTSVQHQSDACSCLVILAKFYFPQNLANFRRTQSLRKNRHATKLFDGFRRIT